MPWEPLPTGDRQRDPDPLGDALARVVRRLGGPAPEVLAGVHGRWVELVGEQVAAHTAPVAIRDGVLVVRVDDPAWATQLRILEAAMLQRLGAVLGDGEVRRVEVRVRAPGTRSDGARGAGSGSER